MISTRARSLADRAVSIAVVASIAFCAYAAYVRWMKPAGAISQPPAPLPQEPVSLDGAITFGSPDAPVAIIIYTDFMCPACASLAAKTLPRLVSEYVTPGKVLLAFRFMSDGVTRPMAYKVAQAGECANRQGRFWPVHDDLFKRGEVLSDDELPLEQLEQMLIEVGRGAGIAEAEFRGCLSSPSVRNDVFEDAGSGVFLGVRATPTLFIGRLTEGRFVEVVNRQQGALPPEVLLPMVDSLQAARSFP